MMPSMSNFWNNYLIKNSRTTAKTVRKANDVLFCPTDAWHRAAEAGIEQYRPRQPNRPTARAGGLCRATTGLGRGSRRGQQIRRRDVTARPRAGGDQFTLPPRQQNDPADHAGDHAGAKAEPGFAEGFVVGTVGEVSPERLFQHGHAAARRRRGFAQGRTGCGRGGGPGSGLAHRPFRLVMVSRAGSRVPGASGSASSVPDIRHPAHRSATHIPAARRSGRSTGAWRHRG